jgi:hypothetical protein
MNMGLNECNLPAWLTLLCARYRPSYQLHVGAVSEIERLHVLGTRLHRARNPPQARTVPLFFRCLRMCFEIRLGLGFEAAVTRRKCVVG